ncbi:AAA family ATPase [Pseudanabaena sp. ABRG5-3]|uniref:AAA family ATPase n=1 Tax=Pseudanabaena sp. ABRG5-3 TaxID=685565 RepID=UPI000DC73C71|nr:AAA family ATPase [Pseudanabaena sp. ABRG5-3]BBC22911.1 hypothetical protein ABRG53_0654 [Pseudanabaena sp. ABRG5-3]
MRLANRTREVEFFKKMLRGEIAQRILLIQAASGMGKTSLLTEFASLCPVHAEAAILVKIDLKSAQTGIAYIFSKLQSRLGEDNFTRFDGELSSVLSAGVEVSGNHIEGTGNKIQLVLNAESDDIRNLRLSKLQRAFFQDLQAIKKPIVIILDSFNDAPTTLAVWIGGGFLAEIADAKNIRVVIAGQSVPELKIEWADIAAMHSLYKIDDADAWYSFSKEQKWGFGKESIELFVRYLNGQPSQILQALESLARGRENE